MRYDNRNKNHFQYWPKIANQSFYYTRSITPKHVTSLRVISASLYPDNITSFKQKKELLQQWLAVGNSVFDLTGRRFVR